jgi:hypothetical protein
VSGQFDEAKVDVRDNGGPLLDDARSILLDLKNLLSEMASNLLERDRPRICGIVAL